MPQSTKTNLREKIRLQVRHQRNHLDTSFQREASIQLVKQVSTIPEITQAKTIALYFTNDGELNTADLIKWCWQHGKSIVLPVLHPFRKGHLLFLHYHNQSEMTHNRYGIAEPKLDVTQVCPMDKIDVIFTPLVAFDEQGQRLGMGGGFYDRTLANIDRDKLTVIGLAHDCQQVQEVPIEPWDVPIPQIVTPTRIIKAG